MVSKFREVTEENVKKEVLSLHVKESCARDTIPQTLLNTP